MSASLLSALRRLRAVQVGDVDVLARALLEVLLEVTRSARVELVNHAEVYASGQASGAERLELCFPDERKGDVRLTLVRANPFDAGDAEVAEVLGGEIASRLAESRARARLQRAARHIELMSQLTRAGAEIEELSALADGAVTAIRAEYPGASVALHGKVGDELHLFARRLDLDVSAVDTAPDWLGRVPLDGPSLYADVVREKRTMSRPVANLPERARAVLEPRNLGHLLVVPLLSDDEVIGTLTVAHRNWAELAADGYRFVEDAACQIAVALAHTRLLADARGRAHDMAMINRIGALVAQEQELDAALTTIVNELALLADVPRVHLLLLDESRTMLESVACTPSDHPRIRLGLSSRSAAGQAIATRAPVVIEDAATDPRARPNLVASVGTRSMMAIPLVSRGEAIGAIAFLETRRRRVFEAHEVARVTAVANLVSPAIANAVMFDALRRSYAALARAQADLVTHERLAALGEISAVIAHEVRNPLAVIFNSLGSLRRLTRETADATLLLDIVGEEATRLNHIVGDLLDFARPYAAHPRPARLDALVRGALDGAERAVGNAGVTVRTDLDALPEEAIVDSTMLQQAISNLVVNAIQASPKGGVVLVRAVAANSVAGKVLRCEVVNQGPGVDAAETERIFKPFFTTKATGTGLGLAVVQRIADALGGAVSVAPAPTGGSVFTLTIPLGADG